VNQLVIFSGTLAPLNSHIHTTFWHTRSCLNLRWPNKWKDLRHSMAAKGQRLTENARHPSTKSLRVNSVVNLKQKSVFLCVFIVLYCRLIMLRTVRSLRSHSQGRCKHWQQLFYISVIGCTFVSLCWFIDDCIKHFPFTEVKCLFV